MLEWGWVSQKGRYSTIGGTGIKTSWKEQKKVNPEGSAISKLWERGNAEGEGAVFGMTPVLLTTKGVLGTEFSFPPEINCACSAAGCPALLAPGLVPRKS